MCLGTTAARRLPERARSLCMTTSHPQLVGVFPRVIASLARQRSGHKTAIDFGRQETPRWVCDREQTIRKDLFGRNGHSQSIGTSTFDNNRSFHERSSIDAYVLSSIVRARLKVKTGRTHTVLVAKSLITDASTVSARLRRCLKFVAWQAIGIRTCKIYFDIARAPNRRLRWRLYGRFRWWLYGIFCWRLYGRF